MTNQNPQKFTPIPPEQLSMWVIWQFPLLISEGMFGAAVRSTEAGSLWWLAKVDAADQAVYLCTSITEPFTTPEEVALFLEQSPFEA